MMVKEQFNIRLEQTTIKNLKQIAKARDKSMADIVQTVLKDYIKMQTVKKEAPEGGIPVIDHETGEIVAMVEYNNNLDFWDGSNWTSGPTGRHKGLTQLENGEYVLIFGTNWQGEKDEAILIDKNRAVNEIMRSRDMELFQQFPDLIPIANGKLIKEKKNDEDPRG